MLVVQPTLRPWQLGVSGLFRIPTPQPGRSFLEEQNAQSSCTYLLTYRLVMSALNSSNVWPLLVIYTVDYLLTRFTSIVYFCIQYYPPPPHTRTEWNEFIAAFNNMYNNVSYVNQDYFGSVSQVGLRGECLRGRTPWSIYMRLGPLHNTRHNIPEGLDLSAQTPIVSVVHRRRFGCRKSSACSKDLFCDIYILTVYNFVFAPVPSIWFSLGFCEMNWRIRAWWQEVHTHRW